jgi:hypothetical protein
MSANNLPAKPTRSSRLCTKLDELTNPTGEMTHYDLRVHREVGVPAARNCEFLELFRSQFPHTLTNKARANARRILLNEAPNLNKSPTSKKLKDSPPTATEGLSWSLLIKFIESKA